MDSNEIPKAFDAYYFAHCCGRPYARDKQWFLFFESIAEKIVSDIQPESVLDAGCAWGFLVEKLRERRINAFGIDISPFAIEKVHPEISQYCTVGSIVEPFSQMYDLIVCIEVLEHMPKGDAERAVKNICDHTSDVLFSSTPFDYKEATHINVQPPEFWAELFARYGFVRDVDFDATFITPWAVRFRRNHDPLTRLVRNYERKLFLLVKENSDLRSLTLEMRDQISQLDQKATSLFTELEKLKTDTRDKSDQLSAIHQSRGWRILQRIQKLRMHICPPGSSCEKMYLRIFGIDKE
jgi:hypothetical protein